MGTLNAISIKLEINNGFRVAKPVINRVLQKKPFDLPTSFLGVFELTAITLAYYDEYIYAGITPKFVGVETEEPKLISSLQI